MQDARLFGSQVLQHFLKEFRKVTRNKEALFFVFLFPVVLLLIMGIIFGGSGTASTSSYRVGVLNLDHEPVDVNGTIVVNGTLGDVFRDVLIEANFTVYNYTQYGDSDTNGTAFYDLSRGQIQAIIIIPENFTECLTFQYTRLINGTPTPVPITPTVEIVLDPTDKMGAQILGQVLRGVVSAFSEALQEHIIEIGGLMDPESVVLMEFLAKPVDSTITEADVTVVEVTWVTYMVPGILGIIILWAGLSNSSRSIASEKDDGTLKRLVMSRASPAALLVGGYLANLFLVLMSAALALVTGFVVFGVNLNWDIPAFIFLTFLVSFSAVGPGLIISSLAKDADSAGAIQVIISIPLQFFVGGFVPIFILPPAAQNFANALPYTKYTLALQDIAVRGLGLLDVMDSIIYMTAFGVVLMVIGVLAYARALKSV